MKTYATPKFLITLAVLGITSSLGSSIAIALPLVPGYTVEVYANVTDPTRLSFSPDGTLYVGRDDGGSGGDGLGATFIHKVSPGGGSVTEYGSASIVDPDSVLFDVSGTISGTPGSVLVGSSWPFGGTGIVSAIHPDESVVTLFGPASVVRNPSEMSFDSTGRMLLVNEHSTGRSVVESTGGTPTVLFTSPSTERPFDLAIDSLDRIYTRDTAGVIRIHDSAGTLVDGSFSVLAAGFTSRGLEIAPGGVWGTDLYAAAPGGNLMQIDALGVASLFGSGFGDIGDIKFGPDGAMYISAFDDDQILRLTEAVPEPSTYAMAAIGLLGLLAYRRFR